jgi:CRP/FNR family transcriptional regulator
MAQRRSIAAGAALFHPGQPCSAFVLVHGGCIRVSLTSEAGREIILYRVGPGQVCLQTFGCLINGQPYSAQGIAETTLEIELVPAAEFQQRIVDDEPFRRQLLAAVAARFGDMERLVEDVALSGFDCRLARTLLRLADGDGAICRTHEALASEMGSGRAAVTRGLGSFAERGLIALARGRVTLLDRAGLAGLAHEAL